VAQRHDSEVVTADRDRTESGVAASSRDWDAASYDRISDPMTRWGAEVLGRLVLHGDETVLDAGAGSGRVTEMLLERLPSGRVVALDAAPSMLAEARKRLARFDAQVTFVESDLLELSPARLGTDAPVDAVLSTATFHWVLDHDHLFANLAGVMRPGAMLAAQCGAAGNIAGLIEAVRSTGFERAGRWLYATPEETHARLEQAGFDEVEVWTHPEPTPLAPGEELETYLETVCLRTHVAGMSSTERARFLGEVAAAMPEPVIDYVRLNIIARRRS
jgi:trans-aconitate 2-methyltransferase